MIDSYDVAIMQRCENTSQKRKEASEILSKNNPNYVENMNSPEGLEGVKKRFVGFNGAVGALQLSWLRQTLGEARKANEKVIIVSHQPIIPESTNPVLRDHTDVVAWLVFLGMLTKVGICETQRVVFTLESSRLPWRTVPRERTQWLISTTIDLLCEVLVTATRLFTILSTTAKRPPHWYKSF